MRKECADGGVMWICAGTSTVWEFLSFHAQLRLPAGTSAEQRESRVWRVISQLGLTKVGAVRTLIFMILSCVSEASAGRSTELLFPFTMC